MSLRDKYSAAIQVAKSVGMQGGAEEKNGKLHFKGTVTSEDQKNQIWNALKTVPSWQSELNAQIDVVPGAASPAQSTGGAGSAAGSGASTYTVQPGDTLSKIARDRLGDATAYMAIFNANTDQLSDPDEIRPGQVLKIPGGA